jgi:hypothetical protein
MLVRLSLSGAALAARPLVSAAVQCLMAPGVLLRTANSYRDQLDRTRRWLRRIENQSGRPDVEYQDFSWAFFNACWSLNDWVKNDDAIAQEDRNQVWRDVHASRPLLACGDVANGTKHLRLERAKIGAAHSHTATEITPGASAPSVVSTVIDMGDGTTRAGLDLAYECVAEWERILTAAGLSIVRLT